MANIVRDVVGGFWGLMCCGSAIGCLSSGGQLVQEVCASESVPSEIFNATMRALYQGFQFLGSGSYVLRWAEERQIVHLGEVMGPFLKWVGVGYSAVTAFIEAAKGLEMLEKVKREGDDRQRTLVFLKIMTNVFLCAWGILGAIALGTGAAVSAYALGGLLVLGGGCWVVQHAYDFHISGTWDKIRRQTDAVVHPILGYFHG